MATKVSKNQIVSVDPSQITTTGATAGQVLTYNASTTTWVASAAPGVTNIIGAVPKASAIFSGNDTDATTVTVNWSRSAGSNNIVCTGYDGFIATNRTYISASTGTGAPAVGRYDITAASTNTFTLTSATTTAGSGTLSFKTCLLHTSSGFINIIYTIGTHYYFNLNAQYTNALYIPVVQSTLSLDGGTTTTNGIVPMVDGSANGVATTRTNSSFIVGFYYPGVTFGEAGYRTGVIVY